MEDVQVIHEKNRISVLSLLPLNGVGFFVLANLALCTQIDNRKLVKRLEKRMNLFVPFSTLSLHHFHLLIIFQ